MNTILEQREIFHLEFLRALNRELKPGTYVLKGGANLRFFFGSIRYSEDIDLDIHGLPVNELKERIMGILSAKTLLIKLTPYRITGIVPPDIGKAKQTDTVQRFKVHLITAASEDLFTKIEFSRRGLDPGIRAESVLPEITHFYRIPPVVIPHYRPETALAQKIRALSDRKQTQARDIFDLYILRSRQTDAETTAIINKEKLAAARKNLFLIPYREYRDTVVSYLPDEERRQWDTEEMWDEMRLKVSDFIDLYLSSPQKHE